MLPHLGDVTINLFVLDAIAAALLRNQGFPLQLDIVGPVSYPPAVERSAALSR